MWPEIGAVFEDRYEILAKLGEGGFGEVYKAAQRTTGQTVALKLMRMPQGSNPARLEKRVTRFMREMRLCAQLHHPNIVQLIDSGRTADSLLYTVFSFAPGDTLADVLAKQGALSPREAQHLMLQVLDALVYAHAQGVIHRDLKPSNIMIIPSGARRNALVLDFGIGAIVEGALGGASDPQMRLTETNETLGTPGYAAPEQLRGMEPSAASDIFAWGLMFIECLTGRPVYTGSSAADILYQQMGPDPVPLPAALERHPLGGLLRRATRKTAGERTASALELFEELDRGEYEPMLRGLSREALVKDEPFVATAGSDSSLQPVPGNRGSIAPSSQGTASEERRQVTVLCCKVSDLTATGEQASERVHLWLEQCVRIAEQHGGHLAAVLDDQVLLYFGYPRAHEDDARRAAQAALAIAHRPAPAGRNEPAPELRMGIHTGVVVAKTFHTLAHGSLTLGSTPHRAMHTAAQARPGEIALTREAYRILHTSFELLAEHATEPGATRFRLPSELRPRRTPTATLDQATSPMIGREQEQSMLLERWSRAQDGIGQCSLITGEPGIGKSRLVRELRARVAEPHIFLECRCSPISQNSALQPVIELLRRLAASDASGLPASASSSGRLEALLARYELSLTEAMPLLGALTSIPISGAADLTAQYTPLALAPHREKELTLECVISLLFSMAEEEPVLLLVEDLHWADPSTLELLTKLVQEAPSAPMYAVLTARPDFSPPFSTAGMLQLHLDRMPAEGVRVMMAELLNHKALPPEVVDQVVSRTDGVPLFVEELTRMMVESDALVLRDGRYELTRPLAQHDIPLTLRDLLTARLDDLGQVKETAQLAAAMGREFDMDLVRAASTDPDHVIGDINHLLTARLVQRQRRKGRGSYVFRHALIRDAAYDSLTQSSRQAVHARIASALEASFAELAESRPDLLAYHHAAAEQKHQALGYAQKAAMGALMRSANAEAIGHVRTALEWLPAIADAKARAQLELGLRGALTPALMATQGHGSVEVAAAAERSLELIDMLGDSAHTTPSLWALTAYHHSASHTDQARGLARRMVEAAERERNAGLLPIALTTLGNCLWVDGHFEMARDALSRALAEYQPEQHRPLAYVFGVDARTWASVALSLVLWALGQPNRARVLAREGTAWAEQIEHTNSICLALNYHAMLHYADRDRKSALECAERLLQLSRRHGLALYNAFGQAHRGWATRELEPANALLAELRDGGQYIGMTFYPAMLAEARAAAGQVDEALSDIETCLKRAEDKREYHNLSGLHRLRGELALLSNAGNIDTAATCFEKAMNVARAQGALMFELMAAMATARLLAQGGDSRAAIELLGATCARIAREEDAWVLTRARALLQQLLDKSD